VPKENAGPAPQRTGCAAAARQRTDRLLLAKAVAAEFEHPALAAVDDELLGVLKREVWELAQPAPEAGSTSLAELLQPPIKTGPSLEDYYGYEPVPGIERGIARRRVEELLARTDPATRARLLATDWAVLDYHARRELLERELGDELSWMEVVRSDSVRRSVQRGLYAHTSLARMTGVVTIGTSRR
jgi:hypothetical protein